MIQTLIVTQGELAAVLLRSAETIAGPTGHVEALSLAWDDTPEAARRKIARVLRRLEPAGGVLILTDMVGGTPYNVARGFRRPGRIEVVAGVNLPMVLRLECMAGDERSVEEVAEWIAAKGRRSISRCREAARRAT